MPTVIGIDVGTSTLKVSRRVTADAVETDRVARTPQTPIFILRAIDRLVKKESADIVAFSSFRRALVVDDNTLILARSSPPQPIVRPTCASRTDSSNAMAPIHRWAKSFSNLGGRFKTFDVWLSERMSGRAVSSESQAWLTGAWDTGCGAWDEATCRAAAIPPEDLPQVLVDPSIDGGMCVPVIGDHEGTAFACAQLGRWPMQVAECGTALACMIGGGTTPPRGLGLESPARCGYVELVDAHFARRVAGESVPSPSWIGQPSPTTAVDVLLAAFARSSAPGRDVVLCGGNVNLELITGLEQVGLSVSVDDTCTSSAGALLLAERAAGLQSSVLQSDEASSS